MPCRHLVKATVLIHPSRFLRFEIHGKTRRNMSCLSCHIQVAQGEGAHILQEAGHLLPAFRSAARWVRAGGGFCFMEVRRNSPCL